MLKLVGWRHLQVTEQGAHLAAKGMLVDLNSCIRPYAIDSVRKILLKEGVEHALIEMDQDQLYLRRYQLFPQLESLQMM